jgi:hypothetical protein
MVCFRDNNLSCFKLLHHVQYFCYFSWTYFGPCVCSHDFSTILVFIKFSFIAFHLFNKGKTIYFLKDQIMYWFHSEGCKNSYGK